HGLPRCRVIRNLRGPAPRRKRRCGNWLAALCKKTGHEGHEEHEGPAIDVEAGCAVREGLQPRCLCMNPSRMPGIEKHRGCSPATKSPSSLKCLLHALRVLRVSIFSRRRAGEP